jgi:DNA-binding response OmpR family regulator
MEYNILVVTPDPTIRKRYGQILLSSPPAPGVSYVVNTANSLGAAQVQMLRDPTDLVIVVLAGNDNELFNFVRMARDVYPAMPLLVLYDQSVKAAQVEPLCETVTHLARYPLKADALLATVGSLLGLERADDDDDPAAEEDEHPTDRLEAQASELKPLLDSLRRETRANLVIYADNVGHIIAQRGDDTDIDIAPLASLISGSFVNSQELGRMLHDTDTIHLSVHEGHHYDVYSANVGHTGLIALFFDKRFVQPKLGYVWLQMKRAAERLRMFGLTTSGDVPLSEYFASTLTNEFDRLFGSELDSSSVGEPGDTRQHTRRIG